jgi:anti-sigma B factor antagonist
MTRVQPGEIPTPRQLELDRREDPDGVVVTIHGELDLATMSELEWALHEIEATNPRRILLDLRGLDFMDGSGLSVMMSAARSAAASGHLLVLRRGPHQVQRLFDLTGLSDHFTFED